MLSIFEKSVLLEVLNQRESAGPQKLHRRLRDVYGDLLRTAAQILANCYQSNLFLKIKIQQNVFLFAMK